MRYFEHTAVVSGVIQAPGIIMYVMCTRPFAFFSCECPLSVPTCFPIPATTTRTAVQNVTSTKTQHSAGQLALHKHLNYQFAPNNHGPLLPTPLFTCFSCILPCASVGRRHLRPLRDFFFANSTRRTADQNVTSPTYSTTHTRQSAPHK